MFKGADGTLKTPAEKGAFSRIRQGCFLHFLALHGDLSILFSFSQSFFFRFLGKGCRGNLGNKQTSTEQTKLETLKKFSGGGRQRKLNSNRGFLDPLAFSTPFIVKHVAGNSV